MVWRFLICAVVCIMSTSVASADTLIFDNSSYTGYIYPEGGFSYTEMLDYGTSPGGRIGKFVFGYVSSSSQTVWVTIYQYTNSTYEGYQLKRFTIPNVPSTNGYVETFEYVIPEDQRFELTNGYFGYSIESSKSIMVALATGGTGIDRYYWQYDDWYGTLYPYDMGIAYNIYFQLYTAPPINEVTCDITGWKFNDADGDGTWDTTESAMTGWEFFLDTNNDGIYQVSEPNTVTDPNGFYMFENVPSPATYRVREIMQDGWTQTLPGTAGNFQYLVTTEPNTVYGPFNFGNKAGSGTTVWVTAAQDTLVNSNQPDTNCGSLNYISAGANGTTEYRSFIQFDLSSIPPGQVITSAKLYLNAGYISLTRPQLGAYHCSDNWNENTLTWNNTPSADSTPLDQQTVNGFETSWTVTADVDNNYAQDSLVSIMIQKVTASPANTWADFSSTESAVPTSRPRLQITYEPIFGGGTGTAADPYLISTPAQMNSIGLYRNRWDRSYKLTADISMAAYAGANYNQIGVWVTGSTGRVPFKGVFDGNGHMISNFYSAALFDYVAWGRIQNLGLNAPTVTDDGAIADRMEYSDMANCWVNGGSVSGGSQVGGLVGYFGGGNMGGCWSSASVSGSSDVGGLIGDISGLSHIQNAYTAGSVNGSTNVGGFVGHTNDSAIVNCYSRGLVTGTTSAGGFCGLAEHSGFPDEIAYNCFWDTGTSGKASSALGTPKTTTQMKTLSTFTSAGWDFVSETANGRNDDWSLATGNYPVLSYQLASPPPLPMFAGGNGTEASPYLVATVAQLNSIGHNRRLMDKHFRLTANLDLAGQPFAMIGDGGYAFMGHFDGNSKTISNVGITIPTYCSNIGFVGCSYGGRISNLTLHHVSVHTPKARNSGSLVGMNRSGWVQNCHSQGVDVSGFLDVGGLVGLNYWYASISHCTVIGRVEETGFLSFVMSGAGGLVGENSWWGTIDNSGAIVDVFGQEYLGGLVGNNVIYSQMTDCYVIGTINADGSEPSAYAGGIAGRTAGAGNLFTRCYVAGEIKIAAGAQCAGVMAGSETGGIYTDCFWDNQINGVLPMFGNTTTSTVLTDTFGFPTAGMKTAATYQAEGWDFANTWRICEGMNYPRLQSQPLPVGDFICPEGVELADLIFMADQWLMTGPSNADIAPATPDGKINLHDFAELTAHWMEGTD